MRHLPQNNTKMVRLWSMSLMRQLSRCRVNSLLIMLRNFLMSIQRIRLASSLMKSNRIKTSTTRRSKFRRPRSSSKTQLKKRPKISRRKIPPRLQKMKSWTRLRFKKISKI